MMMGCHCNEVCAFFVTNLLEIFALHTHSHDKCFVVSIFVVLVFY
jgi:hypothetical protein